MGPPVWVRGAGRTSAGKARVSKGALQTGQGRNEGAFTSDAGSGVAQWGQLMAAAFNAFQGCGL